MKQIINGLKLGEGCVWDEQRQVVYFVDIEGFQIHAYKPLTGVIETIDVGDYVGTLVLDQEGHLVAAIKTSLIHINVETGQQKVLLSLKQEGQKDMRFNDGKCDAHGRLWVGTMALDHSDGQGEGAGSLYCIEDNQVVYQFDDFTIPNGLAWSSDGRYFYHIDTPKGAVDCYDVLADGSISNRRQVIHVDPADGHPDGMTIDGQGNLWVAMWGGSQVVSYNPRTGEKLSAIATPALHTSCCTFGGEDLDQLYVTSASNDGHSGALYEVDRSMTQGIRGLKAFRYQVKSQ